MNLTGFTFQFIENVYIVLFNCQLSVRLILNTIYATGILIVVHVSIADLLSVSVIKKTILPNG
jgi:hypothetical protein